MFRVRIVNVRYKLPSRIDVDLWDLRCLVDRLRMNRLPCRIVSD
jgi:hypothetical protein